MPPFARHTQVQTPFAKYSPRNWTYAGAINQYAQGQYQVTFTPTIGPKRFYAVRLP